MAHTKIAEIQLRILRAAEAIEKARALVKSGAVSARQGKAEVEKHLGMIARLKHEKSRLAMHERLPAPESE